MATSISVAQCHLSDDWQLASIFFQFLILFAKCHSCRTPLHFAVARGNSDVVKTLLEWKASVNVYDNDSKTPLLKVSTCLYSVLSFRVNVFYVDMLCAML